MKNAKKPFLHIVKCAPRGFCAGVARAIQIVELSLEKYGKPVYVRHEIVHNAHVVNDLKSKGAIFVNNLNEIPLEDQQSRPVIFSAHGVAKSVIENAQEKNMLYIDAVCPLVSKVHIETQNYAKRDLHTFLIGHANHPEIIGTMGQLPKGHITLVETIEDAKKISAPDDAKGVALVTQTTLSVDETYEISNILRQRFPDIVEPYKEDICYATTNRQNAIKKIAFECDAIIVVGSPNSSNSCRLVEVAKKAGCTLSYLISSVSDVNIDDFRNVKKLGVTAGASAPEWLVNEIINTFTKHRECYITNQEHKEENISFRIPKILRNENSSHVK